MSLHLPLSNRWVQHSKSTISQGLKVLLDMGVYYLKPIFWPTQSGLRETYHPQS